MTPFTISFRRDLDREVTELHAGEHFRVGIDRFESFFGGHIPTRLIDLLRIASAVHVIDRLAKRRQRDQRRYWSRTLGVTIGALEPEFWSEQAVRQALTDTIEFLSDDTWELAFEKDDRRRAHEVQSHLFVPPPDSRVCLYSGGLDSAAGLGVQIGSDPGRPVLPVTIWHQPGQRKLVLNQHGYFVSERKATITPLVVKAVLQRKSIHPALREESTQRSRAFLFLAGGAAAAAMVGGSRVEIYESGIGAINLPLMAGMVGSRTTRSVHPEFLARMAHLVGLVLDRPIGFVLPFAANTKGQMIGKLAGLGLGGVIPMTASCIHYPLCEPGHKQCGVCPACLFRRQSILAAGLSEPPGTYKFDAFGSAEAANQIHDKQRRYLKAFLDQVVQLDEVSPDAPLPSRFRRHLIGTGILAHAEPHESIARLLCDYRDEWRSIAMKAESLGISWPRLVARTRPAREGASHVAP